MTDSIQSQCDRSQALTDGRLIDITHAASRVGFRVPVAITRAAWLETVCWPDGVMRDVAENQLIDLLRELNDRAVRPSELDPDGVALMRFYRTSDAQPAQPVTIKLCSAIDEAGMPIITVSLANEN